jgi:hypothetical protein
MSDFLPLTRIEALLAWFVKKTFRGFQTPERLNT